MTTTTWLVVGVAVALGGAMAALAMRTIHLRTTARRPSPPIDPVIVAAVSAAVVAIHPEARITRLEVEP